MNPCERPGRAGPRAGVFRGPCAGVDVVAHAGVDVVAHVGGVGAAQGGGWGVFRWISRWWSGSSTDLWGPGREWAHQQVAKVHRHTTKQINNEITCQLYLDTPT